MKEFWKCLSFCHWQTITFHIEYPTEHLSMKPFLCIHMPHCRNEVFKANIIAYFCTASFSLEAQYASNSLSMHAFPLIPAFLPNFYMRKVYNHYVPFLGIAGWIDFFPLKEILSRNLWKTITQLPRTKQGFLFWTQNSNSIFAWWIIYPSWLFSITIQF